MTTTNRGFVGYAVNWLSLKNALGSDDEQLFKQLCDDHEDVFDDHTKQFSKPEEKAVSLKEALQALIFKAKPKDSKHSWVYIHALRLLCEAFGEQLEMNVFPIDEKLITEVDKKIAQSELSGKLTLTKLASSENPPFEVSKAAEWPKIGFYTPEEVSAVRGVLKHTTPGQLATTVFFGKSDRKTQSAVGVKHTAEEEAMAHCLENALQWFLEDAGTMARGDMNEDDGDPDLEHGDGETNTSTPHKRSSLGSIFRQPSSEHRSSSTAGAGSAGGERKVESKEDGASSALKKLSVDDNDDDPTALVELTGKGSTFNPPMSPTAMLSPKAKQQAYADDEEHESSLKFPFGAFGLICFYY